VRVLYLIKVEELPWRKVASIFVAAAGLTVPATVVSWALDTQMSWPWAVRLSVASGVFIMIVGICVRLFRPSLIETIRQAIRKGKKT